MFVPPNTVAGVTSTSPLNEHILQGRKDTESFDSALLHRKTGLTLGLPRHRVQQEDEGQSMNQIRLSVYIDSSCPLELRDALWVD